MRKRASWRSGCFAARVLVAVAALLSSGVVDAAGRLVSFPAGDGRPIEGLLFGAAVATAIRYANQLLREINAG